MVYDKDDEIGGPFPLKAYVEVERRLVAVEVKQDQTLSDMNFLKEKLSGRPSWPVATIIAILGSISTAAVSVLLFAPLG